MAQVSVDRAMQIAAEHERASRPIDAESIYTQIISAFPSYQPAMHGLAILWARHGRLDDARKLLERLIEMSPENAAAHSDLGNVLRDQNHSDEAIACFGRAIALRPDYAIAYCNLGNALRDRARPQEAIVSYQRALQISPDYAMAHSNLGNALSDLGRMEEAAAAYRRAIEIAPGFAAAHSNLGAALHRLERFDEAIASFSRALELDPNYAEAHNNLGHTLEALNRPDDAIAQYVRAIQIRPELAGAYSNLGNALLAKRRIDDAIAAFRTGVRLDANSAEAHNNLATGLSDKGLAEESIAEYRLALRLRPNYPDALSNLASTLIEWGRYDEPERLLRQAIDFDPKFADAHWNLGLFLLMKGDFARGLEEYEWRWKVRRMPRMAAFDKPQWDGRELMGQTVMLHVEQGYGDAIQFIRYVPLVAKRGGKVIVRCPGDLKGLFASMREIEGFSAPEDPLPMFDFHCPLLSLPWAFKTELNSIPASIPYLSADMELAEIWRKRMTGEKRRRIGLAWAGDPRHRNDRNRTIVLCNFAPLAEVTNAEFYSLQKGEGAKHLPPAGLALIDLTSHLADFAQTAAMIANLDLVITSDTSVAHVAGAIGKPVWVLLPLNPDWRWMLDRTDSPWYPTMRLFRQKTVGDWTEVIDCVARGLKAEP